MKMKMYIPFLCAFALVLFFPPALHADEIASIKGGYLVLSPSGHFSGSENGIGTNVDMNELNIGDSKNYFVEGALQLGDFRLAAQYLPLNFSGTGTITSSFSFNGQDFAVGDRVKGDIDINLYDIGLAWYLINMDDLPVRLQIGPEIGAKIADADLKVDSKTTGISEEVSGVGGLPTVGGRARIGLADWVALVARGGYGWYDNNNLLDLEGQVEFSPLPLVGVFGGYKYLDLNIDQSDVVVDATFKGPFGGVFLRF
jgi:hypothetical protein